MMANPFIIERIFDATLTQVWQALTQKELMQLWYFDIADFKAEVGTKFQFTGGPSPEKQYIHLCEILEVIPEKILKHSWCYQGYEGYTVLTFALENLGTQTKLTLTHEGLDSFPIWNPDFEKENFAEGWNHIVNISLKEFLENQNKNKMKTIFTQMPEDKKIGVEREFAGNLNDVWQAWTDPEILDQWWAPKPWKTETVSMDFSQGGKWFYYMQGPDDSRHYCIVNYLTVNPKTSFSGLDAFADETGNKNDMIKSNHWLCTFSETETGTKVNVDLTFETAEDLTKMVEMGFQQGFAMAHDNLDALLLKN